MVVSNLGKRSAYNVKLEILSFVYSSGVFVRDTNEVYQYINPIVTSTELRLFLLEPGHDIGREYWFKINLFYNDGIAKQLYKDSYYYGARFQDLTKQQYSLNMATIDEAERIDSLTR